MTPPPRSRATGPGSTHPPVALPSRNRVTLVDRNDILWIQGRGHHALVHTLKASLEVDRGLARILKDIQSPDIVRIHRSAAVNIAQVRELMSRSHGDWCVTLANGQKLVVTRTFRADFFRRIGFPIPGPVFLPPRGAAAPSHGITPSAPGAGA